MLDISQNTLLLDQGSDPGADVTQRTWPVTFLFRQLPSEVADIFVQAKKQHRSEFNLLEQKALPTPGDQVGVLGHKKYPNPRQKGDKELTLTRRYLVETL